MNTNRTARQTCLRKRSEEHTSELQSQSNLVCRLLLEKKNKTPTGPAGDAPAMQPFRATEDSPSQPHRDVYPKLRFPDHPPRPFVSSTLLLRVLHVSVP